MFVLSTFLSIISDIREFKVSVPTWLTLSFSSLLTVSACAIVLENFKLTTPNNTEKRPIVVFRNDHVCLFL